MKAGGAPFDEDDESPALVNVDCDIDPFPEHRADWEASEDSSERQYDGEGSPVIERGVWLYETRQLIPWREKVQEETGGVIVGEGERRSEVEFDEWEAGSVGVGASVFVYSNTRAEFRVKALRRWQQHCERLREERDEGVASTPLVSDIV